MKSRLNIRQKIFAVIAIIFLILLMTFGPSREAHAGDIEINMGDGERRRFDLTDPAQQAEFRGMFGHMPKLRTCFAKGDYAISLMNERDAGTTEQEHLDRVKDQYELTKTEPDGVVSYHTYIDFQRMVRDIHHVAGRNTEATYRYTNAYTVWDREFRWCALP